MAYKYNVFTGDFDLTSSADIPEEYANQFVTDAGTATPVSNVLNVLGDATQGISDSGAGNTITFTISDASESQKGVTELATNAEAIAGSDTVRSIVPSSLEAKLGNLTLNSIPYGPGTGSAISWSSALVDGQLMIGGAGIAPIAANLSSSGGTVTITNGPNSIDLDVHSSISNSFVTDAGTATPAANVLDVLGGTNISTTGAGNTVTVNLNGTTDHSIQLGNATGSLTSLGVGSTGTVLTGVTGADPAFSSTPTVTTVFATTFDTNVAAAGVTLSGTTLSADGTDLNIPITLTPKGSEAVTIDGLDYPMADGNAGECMVTSGAGVLSLGILTVPGGGSGAATFTDHGVLLGSGTGAFSVTAAPTDGQLLIGSTGVDPVLGSLTAGTGITVTPGAGSISIAAINNGTVTSVSGTASRISSTGGATPVIDIDAAYVGQSSITTLGTVTTGTWTATDIAVADGGTGRSSHTAYAVLCGGTTTTAAQQSIAGVGTAGQVLTSNGAAALPTFQAAAAGGGILLQRVSANTSAYIACSTVMPFDDTIPQQTEGTEVLTVAITPTNVNNILEVEFSVWGTNGSNRASAALFQDSTANALAAICIVSITIGGNVLRHRMVAGTVSSTTFKIRVGPSAAATIDVNGYGSARIYGGVSSTYLTVTEYKV